MSFASISIKTSIPVTAPAATSGALTFSTIEDENWLQITGDVSAGSGSLYVLRWNADLAEWRPYMEDKPIAVDSATLNGLFSAYYPFPKGEESFCLYDPASAITATASAARTGSPLAPLSPASSSASGGATEAKQDAGNTSLVSILGQLDNKTSTLATALAQTTGNSSLSSIDGKVATAAKQDTGNTSLSSIATQQTDGTQKTQVTNTVTVTGPLTDTQLRATPVPVSGTVTATIAGVATATNQTTLGNQTTKINDGTNTVAVKAANTAALATDTAIVVAVSPNNTPVLPSGAATEAKQPALGTAGTPSADVLSVQGVPGGTPQPISATSLPLPMGAATSALQGAGLPAALVGGKLDVNLGTSSITLPVSVASTGSTGAAVPASASLIGGRNTAGNLTALAVSAPNAAGAADGLFQGLVARANAATQAWIEGAFVPLSVDPTYGRLRVQAIGTNATPASQTITTADLVSTTVTGQSGQSIITGTPTTNSAAVFALQTSFNTTRIVVTGTWSGTLQVETTVDPNLVGPWYPANCSIQGRNFATPTFTANGQGPVNTGGMAGIRVRATAFVSGTATISVAQTANLVAFSALSTRLIDGAGNQNSQTVLAASTAPAATDLAAVVAISPNSAQWVAQNSTTGGQQGSLAMGAVTTSAPTYVNARTQPLSLDTSGGLRVAQAAGSGSAASFWFMRVTDGTNTQPTMDTAARSGFQRITDGTNTAAVKASSTAAVATDPAVVVAVRPQGSSFFNCAGVNETRTLKSGAGVLRRVIVNPGSGGSTCTIYDNTAGSGTVIHSFTTSSAGALPFTLTYDLAFSTGLTYVTATGTQGNLTFVWD